MKEAGVCLKKFDEPVLCCNAVEAVLINRQIKEEWFQIVIFINRYSTLTTLSDEESRSQDKYV